MSTGDLDLRLSVFEGPSPRISELILHARLLAAPAVPDGPSEYLILGRDVSRCPPSWISRSDVAAAEVTRLVALLDAAGLPRRVPRVVANESLLGAGPYLALEARSRGRTASLDLPLQNAGFSGADSESLRAVLRLLAELAPAGPRAAVREVVGRLIADRAAFLGPGGFRERAGGRGDFGPGRPAGTAPEMPLLAASGLDRPAASIPAFPRGALADR